MGRGSVGGRSEHLRREDRFGLAPQSPPTPPVTRLCIDLWLLNLMAGDEPIRLVAADPGWPARFDEEREALAAAIEEWAPGGIHHVGSTAVAGLEAKPIIDILVGVRDLETAKACFGPLADLGYLYAPYLPEEMHWFCKPDPAHRTHHLHLIPLDSQRFRDELAFRDRLREDPQLVKRYAALKRRLAREHPNDREAYTDGKTPFVAEALAE